MITDLNKISTASVRRFYSALYHTSGRAQCGRAGRILRSTYTVVINGVRSGKIARSSAKQLLNSMRTDAKLRCGRSYRPAFKGK